MTYILVAEDDPHIQLLVRRKLEGAGFEVRTTPNGNEVLSIVLASPPAVVLLDIMLPGTDGLTICRAIKQQMGENAPPIIMMSARGQQSDVDAGFEVGADDYVIKPFSPRDILDRVQAAVRRH